MRSGSRMPPSPSTWLPTIADPSSGTHQRARRREPGHVPILRGPGHARRAEPLRQAQWTVRPRDPDIGGGVRHPRGSHLARAQLNEALVSRDAIGQAKGLLMIQHDITSPHAFDLLVRVSQKSNIKLTELASWIVPNHEQPGWLPRRRAREPRSAREAKKSISSGGRFHAQRTSRSHTSARWCNRRTALVNLLCELELLRNASTRALRWHRRRIRVPHATVDLWNLATLQ
ncbi:ANTAR domain-containing protein [Salinifilum ghardaiensis]